MKDAHSPFQNPNVVEKLKSFMRADNPVATAPGTDLIAEENNDRCCHIMLTGSISKFTERESPPASSKLLSASSMTARICLRLRDFMSI